MRRGEEREREGRGAVSRKGEGGEKPEGEEEICHTKWLAQHRARRRCRTPHS